MADDDVAEDSPIRIALPVRGTRDALSKSRQGAIDRPAGRVCTRGAEKVAARAVDIDPAATQRLCQQWRQWDPGVALKVLPSPHRNLIEATVSFVEVLIHRGRHVTVLLARVEPRRRRYRFLHNQRGPGPTLAAALRARTDAVVATVAARVDLTAGSARRIRHLLHNHPAPPRRGQTHTQPRPPHYRVRHDTIDAANVITARYNRRLHHRTVQTPQRHPCHHADQQPRIRVLNCDTDQLIRKVTHDWKSPENRLGVDHVSGTPVNDVPRNDLLSG
ncbi:hypothetical protein MTY59_45900 [Mycobacterium senriense]|uniref:Transposase n=1 Tax=Mycobacterium senriense TaxID=2775496 RepID=A0ABN6IQA3_9MYCO|nr:hypothetical protein MTY59_45900 [Mycobacterium senriense]